MEGIDELIPEDDINATYNKIQDNKRKTDILYFILEIHNVVDEAIKKREYI